MSDDDTLQRFLFSADDIRGELVSLAQCQRKVLANHPHPDRIASLVGEFLAAVSLISATLKFEGIITLQAKPASTKDGLAVVMAECSHQKHLRAIVRNTDNKPSSDAEPPLTFAALHGGHLVITVTPAKGQQYQGIVAIEHDFLATCINSYFAQSEQLPTQVWLAADKHRAAGLLLQALPLKVQSAAQRSERWQHLTQLATTLRAEEQLSLSHRDQLNRLFHGEYVRLFTANPLEFRCSCSQQRMHNALRTMGQREVETLLDEQGHIEIRCEFCHFLYKLDRREAQALFTPQRPTAH